MRLRWLLCVALACSSSSPTPAPAPTSSASASASPSPSPNAPPALGSFPAPPSDWCTDGLSALDDSTCFVLPDALSSPRVLVVYLHGIVPTTGHAQRIVQQIVAENARARGYVALLPRGRRGIGPKGMRDWWGWPTTAAAYAKYAGEMTAEWLDEKTALEARVGAPFERMYLAGSSNGAYFVTTLALAGAFPVDGYGAMSGGGRGAKTKRSIAGTTTRPPFYVGYGTFDDAKTDPIGLGDLLAEAEWPHEVRAHAVGHGARAVYLDEALEFWGSGGGR